MKGPPPSFLCILPSKRQGHPAKAKAQGLIEKTKKKTCLNLGPILTLFSLFFCALGFDFLNSHMLHAERWPEL